MNGEGCIPGVGCRCAGEGCGAQLSPIATAAAAAAAAPWHSGWQLVWSDEFDAASCVNGRPSPEKWGFEHGMVRNHEAQWYQEDNARCVNGSLVITAERVTPDPEKGNAEYTSSSMVTRETAQWEYGRMEMRGKIDVRSGSWPAWWTIGNDTGTLSWPECGEVDIMEYCACHGSLSAAPPPSTMRCAQPTASVVTLYVPSPLSLRPPLT